MKKYSFRLCSNKNTHKYYACLSCQKNALIICFVINFIMFAVELIYGLIYNSAALLGDSAHNVGDAFILGSSIVIISASEIVKARLALLKAIIMASFALLTLYHAYNNFLAQNIPNYVPMISIGFCALLGNIISTFILFIYRDRDINLKSSYVCVRNDTLGNILTIIAGIVVMQNQSYIPDVVVGAAIGIFVIYSAINIAKESFNIIRK